MAEHLASVWEALDSIPTTKERKNEREREKEKQRKGNSPSESKILRIIFS